jgi:hypothetical protein
MLMGSCRGRFRGDADMNRPERPAKSGENDPFQTKAVLTIWSDRTAERQTRPSERSNPGAIRK